MGLACTHEKRMHGEAMSDDAEDRLRAAMEKSYAEFRAEQQARGRPVCDGFEPCDAAKASPSPWADAPECTPCKRCSWSKRTHDSGASGASRAATPGKSAWD